MIDADAAGRDALLRTERRIGVVINAVLSIGFFLLVFGWRAVASRDLAFDFLPQTFGITFLGTLVPSLLTFRRIARGTVVPAGRVPSLARHLLRTVACALVATLVLGGCAAVLLIALAPVVLPPAAGIALKALYGSVVGFIVTPPILRMALAMPFLPGARPPALATEAR
jgi:ABC-type phosphate/phosphonate transport system permease subunit